MCDPLCAEMLDAGLPGRLVSAIEKLNAIVSEDIVC